MKGFCEQRSVCVRVSGTITKAVMYLMPHGSRGHRLQPEQDPFFTGVKRGESGRK